ncbi:Fic family protein [Clostridium sp. C105KSO13]|uniref:Fic family protein n=1 Tax=Clostridium sp. C105KSO13 TaxID=1776045 RepID=UPI000AD5BBBC|nr:Fic family protein [Clostridium sp. C105KSO13]
MVYYPPEPERVLEFMQRFFEKWENTSKGNSLAEIMQQLAEQHIEFEQIHPFQDGNGRVGRMLMNQELINQNLLPIAINPTGKYRQAFQCYEKKGDLSLMVHQVCKAELEAIQRVQCLVRRREQSRQKTKCTREIL